MSQAPVPNYSQPAPANKPAGMAIASMVLGIISLVLFCVWWAAIPCAIIAIILGFVAKGKAERGEAGGAGMAKAGLICGIIAIALAIVIVILAVVGISMFGSKMQEIQKEIERQNRDRGTTGPSGILRFAIESVYYSGRALFAR